MLRSTYLLAAAAVMAAATATSPNIAGADQMSYPTKVISTPGSPVTLTHCATTAEPAAFLIASDATNRTSIFLISYVVRWFAYDHSGVGIGQYDYTYTFRSDLAPNDTDSSSQTADFLTEPSSALASMSCRMEAAKFEGGRSWTYGRRWSGPLTPLPRRDSTKAVPTSGSHATSMQRSQIDATVTNTWNDVVNGSLFVHVALDIRAADRDVAFGPQDVALAMKLVGGSTKTYRPMAAAAPTYQKLTPLGQNNTTEIAFEVDPKEDLGIIGSLHVPAHTKAHIVATFQVGTDAIANVNDNRQVVIQ